MNKPVHAIAGGATGVSTYLLIKKVLGEKSLPIEAFICSIIGALAGTLPDKLEPATSSHHRSVFHSASLLVMLSYVFYRLLKADDTENVIKILSLVSISGYGSHLILDSTTPARLPLL